MTREIDNLRSILKELQKIDPEFPLQYALCLLEIAADEGLSLTALAERVRLPLSTVSRIVGALSSKRQKGQPYGLVKVSISAAERRRKELTLTARGRTAMEGLSAVIKDLGSQ